MSDSAFSQPSFGGQLPTKAADAIANQYAKEAQEKDLPIVLIGMGDTVTKYTQREFLGGYTRAYTAGGLV